MHALGAARRRHSAKRSNANGAPPAKRARACDTGSSAAQKLPASRPARAGGYRSPLVSIQGTGPASHSPVPALPRVLANALSRTGRVPLATPARFPEPGEPGCAVLFTDAAREDGTGGGAFLAIARQADTPLFFWCGFEWPADIRAALQSDLLSMPAGELGMLVGIAPALMAACEARGICVTHLICMTDSIATRATANHDSSPSPQLNFLRVSAPKIRSPIRVCSPCRFRGENLLRPLIIKT